MKRIFANIAVLVLALGVVAGAARAQDQPQEQSGSQPGVARISLIHGNVSVQRADSGEWVAATLNTPLMNGDTISTGPNSRAEVQLDYANVLRLDSSSTAKIANLNRNQIQVQIAQGLVSFGVLSQDQTQAEIDTPNVAVHPLGNGSYRIRVDSNDQSMVTVRRGEADVSTPQGSTRVESGELITIRGADNPEYQTTQAGPEDSWDRWNASRDRIIRDASSWRHTDRYYTGSQDLDAYGHWVYVPNYGSVWQPYQRAGWAPYRDGRWVWEPFYGWTWVSYEPWGWAPYHYGRWFLYGSDWCWWPGPVSYYPAYYPVWAPAYVSFFGFGYGGGSFSFGFGLGFGNIGWLPIGPADPYFPWYGRGRGFNVINITNINYIRNDYDRDRGFAPLYRGRGGYSNFESVRTNRRLRDGVSWMSGKEFGRAPVPRQRGHIDSAEFRQARMFSGRVPVMPSRESLRATNHAPNPETMRRGVPRNQRFFTNGHAAPRPTSFSQQKAELERTIRGYRNSPAARGGGAFTSSGRRSGSFGATRPNGRNSSAPSSNNRRGASAPNFTQGRNTWQRFGNSGSQRPAQAPRAPAQRAISRGVHVTGAASSNSNWHNFSQQNRGSAGNAARSNQVRPNPRAGQANRNVAPQRRNSTPTQAPASRPGWKNFAPQPGQSRNAPPARRENTAPAQRQGGFRTFTPSSRPAPQASGRRNESGRRPLNLRQPIVQQRNQRNQAPRNNGPRNFSSRPNYGGRVSRGGSPSYAPPRGPTSRSGGSPRGGYSAPRSGGNSAPRGGGFSAPRGGGHSAPRGNSGGGARRSSGGHGHGR